MRSRPWQMHLFTVTIGSCEGGREVNCFQWPGQTGSRAISLFISSASITCRHRLMNGIDFKIKNNKIPKSHSWSTEDTECILGYRVSLFRGIPFEWELCGPLWLFVTFIQWHEQEFQGMDHEKGNCDSKRVWIIFERITNQAKECPAV